MIREVKLNTLGMFTRKNFIEECDYELWQKIAEFIDGEMALVIDTSDYNGEYLFYKLTDENKNKELCYMREQDSRRGKFFKNREGFDKAWDSEDYEPDVCFYIEPQYLIFEESGGK